MKDREAQIWAFALGALIVLGDIASLGLMVGALSSGLPHRIVISAVFIAFYAVMSYMFFGMTIGDRKARRNATTERNLAMPRYLVQTTGTQPSTDRRLDEHETLEEACDSAQDWSDGGALIQVWDTQAGVVAATFLNAKEIR